MQKNSDRVFPFIVVDVSEKRIINGDSRPEFFPLNRGLPHISNQNLLNLIQNKNTMNQKIAIKVGTPALSEIVQQFLFTKGFRWPILGENKVINVKEKYLNLGAGGGKDITHCSYHFKPEEYPLYDAATDFGKIVDLFNEPPKPVIKVKNDAGNEYEAKFSKDGVTFGCAFIDNQLFINCDAFCKGGKLKPNSKYVEQIKIGRGLFTPEIIAQIVKHPDFAK